LGDSPPARRMTKKGRMMTKRLNFKAEIIALWQR
jgi:hypothetical protein